MLDVEVSRTTLNGKTLLAYARVSVFQVFNTRGGFCGIGNTSRIRQHLR